MHRDDRLTELPPPPPASLPDASSPVTIRVVAFALFVYALWPFLVMFFLMAIGLVPRPSTTPTPAETQALMRAQLLTGALAFPLQIASILWLLRPVAGVRLEQIGLTWRRLGWNCLWGAAGWLILTPICYIADLGVIALYGQAAASNVQEHPFVQMSQQGLTPLEWSLLILTATSAAPVMEEILFRGALQAWLEERSWAPHVVMGLAFLTTLAMKGGDISNALPQGGATLLLHLTPVLFIVGLSVVHLAVWLFSRSRGASVVFAASALFASVHSFAWPEPVPLFLLGLGLGWLAFRTRSLAGPIVLHSLFNAVACVELILQANGVSP